MDSVKLCGHSINLKCSTFQQPVSPSVVSCCKFTIVHVVVLSSLHVVCSMKVCVMCVFLFIGHAKLAATPVTVTRFSSERRLGNANTPASGSQDVYTNFFCQMILVVFIWDIAHVIHFKIGVLHCCLWLVSFWNIKSA